MPFEKGKSGNPSGRVKDKPFRDALIMAVKEVGDNDPKALRGIATALLGKACTGDVPAIKEVADRLDGKIPQAVVGDDEYPPIQSAADPRDLASAVMDILRLAQVEKE